MERMRSRNWSNTLGLQRRAVGFYEIFINGYMPSIFGDWLGCKPIPGGTQGQLMEQRPTYRADFALDITLYIPIIAIGVVMHKNIKVVGYSSIGLAFLLAIAGYFLPAGYAQDLVIGTTGTFLGLGIAVLAINYFLGASDRKAAAAPLLKLILPNMREINNVLLIDLLNDHFGIDEAKRLIEIYTNNRGNPKAFSPEQRDRLHAGILTKKTELLRVHSLLGEQLKELSTLVGWSFDSTIVAAALEARLNFVAFQKYIDLAETEDKYKLIEAYIDGVAAAKKVVERLTQHLGLASQDWQSDV